MYVKFVFVGCLIVYPFSSLESIGEFCGVVLTVYPNFFFSFTISSTTSFRAKIGLKSPLMMYAG